MMTEAPVMCLSDFSNAFEATCDASGLKIGGVLSQQNHHVAYFSEKLNDALQRYSRMTRNFMRLCRLWAIRGHYLLPREFVLYSDHETLKYLNSQKRLNERHSKWVEFIQDYTFILRHKARVENQGRWCAQSVCNDFDSMSVEVTGFERLREEYESCPGCGEICHIMERFYLKNRRLSVIYLRFISYVFPVHPSGISSLEVWLDISARTRQFKLLSTDSTDEAWRGMSLRSLASVVRVN